LDWLGRSKTSIKVIYFLLDADQLTWKTLHVAHRRQEKLIGFGVWMQHFPRLRADPAFIIHYRSR
jgi:hypothetical protein